MNKKFKFDRPLIKLYSLFFFSLSVSLIILYYFSPNYFYTYLLNSKVRIKEYSNLTEIMECGKEDEQIIGVNNFNGSIILLFENGWQSTYDFAMPIQKNLRFKGTLAINSDIIVQYNAISYNQLMELSCIGWDIIYNFDSKENDELQDIFLNQISEANWLKKIGQGSYTNIISILDRELNQNDFIISEQANFKYILGVQGLWKISDTSIKIADFQIFDASTISNINTLKLKIEEMKNSTAAIAILFREIQEDYDYDGLNISKKEYEEIIELISNMEINIVSLGEYITMLDLKD